jgi:hypothetical protein
MATCGGPEERRRAPASPPDRPAAAVAVGIGGALVAAHVRAAPPRAGGVCRTVCQAPSGVKVRLGDS